jgi:3-hydroxyisobutyrate dehydrogenase
MTRVAVLGLGAMGSGLAANLVATGHTVTVWNRTRSNARALSAAIGVQIEDSPAAAVAAAEVVLACVADDEASAAVWLSPDGGALAALPGAAVAVEASTLSPGWIRRLGAAADERGVRFVEAPIIGSRPQLAARQLVHLCGGDRAVVDEVREQLAASASLIHHIGPTGDAATVKLIINGLFAAQAAVGAELLSVLAGSSVDLEAAVEVLASLPTTSPALMRLLGLMRRRAFAPNFPIRLVTKDLNYLAHLARQAATDTPMLATTLSRFRAAEAAGLAEIDIAGIADLT